MINGVPVPRETVIRQRQFPASLGMATIARVLQNERFTGTLHVHFGQGAVNAMTAEDAKKTPKSEPESRPAIENP